MGWIDLLRSSRQSFDSMANQFTARREGALNRLSGALKGIGDIGEARKQRKFLADEREDTQEFQTGEREATQEFQTGEREAGEEFAAEQASLERQKEITKERLDRQHDIIMQGLDRSAQTAYINLTHQLQAARDQAEFDAILDQINTEYLGRQGLQDDAQTHELDVIERTAEEERATQEARYNLEERLRTADHVRNRKLMRLETNEALRLAEGEYAIPEGSYTTADGKRTFHWENEAMRQMVLEELQGYNNLLLQWDRNWNTPEQRSAAYDFFQEAKSLTDQQIWWYNAETGLWERREGVTKDGLIDMFTGEVGRLAGDLFNDEQRQSMVDLYKQWVDLAWTSPPNDLGDDVVTVNFNDRLNDRPSDHGTFGELFSGQDRLFSSGDRTDAGDIVREGMGADPDTLWGRVTQFLGSAMAPFVETAEAIDPRAAQNIGRSLVGENAWDARNVDLEGEIGGEVDEADVYSALSRFLDLDETNAIDMSFADRGMVEAARRSLGGAGKADNFDAAVALLERLMQEYAGSGPPVTGE